MLIRRADVWGHGLADLRIDAGRITAIGQLVPGPDEPVIEAAGAALLPGLHDHHLHLAALAARQASVPCGPPAVTDETELAASLQRPGTGWLRGVGYHESVMGLPDAHALDALLPSRPLRIQHRGGRMWLLNSLAIETLLAVAPPPAGLERIDGRYTGRLFDEDQWLRAALDSQPPDFAEVSGGLARLGVTGVTDMSPRNDAAMARHFAAQRETGALVQRLTLAGMLELAGASQSGWSLGPAKLHLHESALPDFDECLHFTRAAHEQARGLAVHCVTEVELVFTLALFEAAGTAPGDRIEHLSIADPHHVARIAASGLPVCVQPHFVTERGDQYLRDVEQHDQPHLYRLLSLTEAGVILAGGSDAPFGSDDPWAAMAAAVSRRTASGDVIGGEEALSPEQALALYLADPADLHRTRNLSVGAPADLCLLDRAWRAARADLGSVGVRMTVIAGELAHHGVDQPPLQRLPGVDPLA